MSEVTIQRIFLFFMLIATIAFSVHLNNLGNPKVMEILTAERIEVEVVSITYEPSKEKIKGKIPAFVARIMVKPTNENIAPSILYNINAPSYATKGHYEKVLTPRYDIGNKITVLAPQGKNGSLSDYDYKLEFVGFFFVLLIACLAIFGLVNSFRTKNKGNPGNPKTKKSEFSEIDKIIQEEAAKVKKQ